MKCQSKGGTVPIRAGLDWASQNRKTGRTWHTTAETEQYQGLPFTSWRLGETSDVISLGTMTWKPKSW